jgi:hypothetical protein
MSLHVLSVSSDAKSDSVEGRTCDVGGKESTASKPVTDAPNMFRVLPHSH